MKKEIILALSTHWDREWYQTFQDFRYRLVETLDAALDTLEKDSRIAVFHLDGQTVLLEDYLEIRPERAGQLSRLASAGRILAGPWYTMPDTWLVSPESLLRNLKLGGEIAGKYGSELREGYLCDIFGFHSQVPQILDLAGIHSAFVVRGARRDLMPRDFMWSAPDGSEVFCHRFDEDSNYSEFTVAVRHADRLQGRRIDIPAAAERAVALLKRTFSEQNGPVCLLMDGTDHGDLDPDIGDLVDAVNERLEGAVLKIGSLTEFVRKWKKSGSPGRYSGELRWPAIRKEAQNFAIQNCLSSYANLKLWNRRVESLLARWTEPMEVLSASMNPSGNAHAFLATAWKWLLQNHAHDSICGCSIDAVHQDMEFRFRQAEQLGEGVLSRSFETLLRMDGPNSIGENGIELAVFNPMPVPVKDITEVELELPVPVFKVSETDITSRETISGYPHQVEGLFGESFPLLEIKDATGLEVPHQILEIKSPSTRRDLVRGALPKVYEVQRVRLTLPVEVPPLGMTVLNVAPRQQPLRLEGSLFSAPSTLENEFLRACVAPSGAITMLDKKTGREYSGLFVFEDGADTGDGWFFVKPKNDRVCYSGQPSEIGVVQEGPLQSVLRLVYVLRVPKKLERKEFRRSAELGDLRIELFLTLKRDGVMLESEIHVHNTIEDHRLRVQFRTGLKSDNVITSTPADLIDRPIARPAVESQGKEQVNSLPTDGVVMIREKSGEGLAALCPGIYESWVADDGTSTIALTLLRSFHRTVMTDGETRCQIPGTHVFRVALLPLQSDTRPSGVFQCLDRFELGLRTAQKKKGNGPVLENKGFLEIVSGEFRLTALVPGEKGGFNLRGYNPSNKPSRVVLKTGLPFRGVRNVDLGGKNRGKVARKGSKVEFSLRPKQYVNLQFSHHA